MMSLLEPLLALLPQGQMNQLGAALALAVAAFSVVAYGLNVEGRWKYRHLPGPTPRLFVGNLGATKGRNIWDVVGEWSRTYGKIYCWFEGRNPVVVISDPDMAQEVMVRKFNVFTNRVMPGIFNHLGKGLRQRMNANMVWAKDKDWASVRSAVMPFFHSGELKSYSTDMNRSISRTCEILASHASSKEPADVRKYFGALALEVVGTSAFGVDFKAQTSAEAEDQDPLVEAVTALFKSDPVFGKIQDLIQVFPWMAWLFGLVLRCLPLLSAKMRKAAEYRRLPAITTYVLLKNAETRLTGCKEGAWPDKELDLPWGEAKFNPKLSKYADVVPAEGSLPDLLMKGKHKLTGEPLSYVQMVAQSAVFLLAGYDTTANTLSYALWLLATHPGEQEKAMAEATSSSKPPGELTSEDLADLPYIRAIVDETLRMYPPAPATSRKASKDTMIAGHFIPAGTDVRVDIMGMHYDPDLFPDPKCFRPSRFLKDSPEAKARHQYAYLPFGAGPRMCIGYKFALQEIMLTLVTVLRSYSFALDTTRDQTELKTTGLVTMGPAEGVWLKVARRELQG